MGVHLFNFKGGSFVTMIETGEVPHSPEHQFKALDTLAASENLDAAQKEIVTRCKESAVTFRNIFINDNQGGNKRAEGVMKFLVDDIAALQVMFTKDACFRAVQSDLGLPTLLKRLAERESTERALVTFPISDE